MHPRRRAMRVVMTAMVFLEHHIQVQNKFG